MTSVKSNYVIIYTNGRADNVLPEKSNWYSILDVCYLQAQSAGSSTPLANKLLRDGEVIVPTDLHQLAWNYGEARQKSISEAIKCVNGKFPEPNMKISGTSK